MQTTFRDFLLKNIEKDRAFHILQPTINEMARYKEAPRKPVHIDKEDIEFLQQFPHQYWGDALFQRYQLLFKAVQKLDKLRDTLGHSKLKNALLKAFKTGDYSEAESLEGEARLKDEEIQKLKKTYDPRYIATLDEKHAEEIADKIAWEHMKTVLDNVDDPKSHNFDFTKRDFDHESGQRRDPKSKEKITITAKPFLNRLYHKIERTEGLPHLDGSGLEGTIAKYGFDLRNPVEDPKGDKHASEGFSFPRRKQTKDRMQDFLNLNMHRIFGDHVDDPDVVWKRANGEDTWTAEQILKDYRKQIEADLRKSEPDSTQDEIEAKAREMAKAKLAEKYPNGELKGPPVPGVSEEGFPVTFRKNADGTVKIVNPPLYLPYKEKEITVNGRTEKHLIPLVNAATFYRRIKSSDYVRNQDGKVLVDDKGQPMIRGGNERLRGHKKDWIAVSDEEAKHQKYGTQMQKGGSIDPNFLSPEKLYLSPGTPEFEEAWNKVFADQPEVDYEGGKIVEKAHTGMYRDLVKGILNCIRNNCGGTTSFESAIMIGKLDLIHQGVYNHMLQELGRQEGARNLATKNGRKLRAQVLASLYAQKDQGGGTRRLRALSDVARARMTRTTGQRRFDTTGDKFPYTITNLRALLTDLNNLRAKAAKADQEAQAVVQSTKNKKSISDNLDNVIQNSIRDSNEVANDLVTLLAAIHAEFATDSEVDSKKYAEDQIKSWVEEGKNSQELVAAFQSLDVVQKAMAQLPKKAEGGEAGSEAGGADLNKEIQDAIRMAGEDYAQDLRTIGKNSPQFAQKYKATVPGDLSRYVQTVLKQKLKGEHQWLGMPEGAEDLDKVLKAVQSSIDQRMAMPEQPASAPQAPEEPKAAGRFGRNPGTHYSSLIRSRTPEGYFHAAHDPKFHDEAAPQLVKGLHNAIKNSPDQYHPEDHSSALNTLSDVMRRRGIN
jgi:hypothetical protein